MVNLLQKGANLGVFCFDKLSQAVTKNYSEGNIIKYPIAIESGDEEYTWSVVVPDLPGCFANGNTLNEALENSKEAIKAWLEFHIEGGGAVPQPKSISEHQSDSDLSRWIWTLINVDLSD